MNVTFNNHAGCPIISEMGIVINAVFAKDPQLEFVAKGRMEVGTRSGQINRFGIYRGLDKLGAVDAIFTSYRGSSQWVYRVSHDDIKNKRGSDGIKKTINPKQAVRLILEYFKPLQVSAIAQEIIDEGAYVVRNAVTGAKITWDSIVNRNMPELELLFQYSVGALRDDGTPMHDKVAAFLTNADLVAAVDTLRIARSVREQFENHAGIVIRIEHKEAIRVVDLKTRAVKVIESTYDLPEHYQEKFAMLKVFDDKQPIEHIGIKIDRVGTEGKMLYFLIDGATVTTC